jgi:hypothetical protein
MKIPSNSHLEEGSVKVDIIKTWPAQIDARTTARVFSPDHPPFTRYYFSLGRGKPKQEIGRMWFNYQGRIIGSFEVEEIVCNDGTLPKLHRLDGGESGWQIRKDAWVAICAPPCERPKERIFHDSFRGWRYFDLERYRGTVDARYRA